MKNNWLSYYCAAGSGPIISKLFPLNVLETISFSTFWVTFLLILILKIYFWIQESEVARTRNSLTFYQEEQYKPGVIVCCYQKYLQLSRISKRLKRELTEYHQYFSKCTRFIKCVYIFFIMQLIGIISGCWSYYAFGCDPNSHKIGYQVPLVVISFIMWVFLVLVILFDLENFVSIHYNRRIDSVSKFHYNYFRCLNKASDNLIVTDNFRHSVNYYLFEVRERFNQFLADLYYTNSFHGTLMLLVLCFSIFILFLRLMGEASINHRINKNNITDLIKI